MPFLSYIIVITSEAILKHVSYNYCNIYISNINFNCILHVNIL